MMELGIGASKLYSTAKITTTATITILSALVDLTPVRANKKFYCTGLRIHEDWVITSAHCVDEAEKVTVRQLDFEKRITKVTESDTSAEDIYIYKEYFADKSFHDLALIKNTNKSQPHFFDVLNLSQNTGSRVDGHKQILLETLREKNIKAARVGLSLNSDQEPDLTFRPIRWVNKNYSYDPLAKSEYELSDLMMLFYKNDKTKKETVIGHSGGPVFVIQDNKPKLLAIHSGLKGGANGDDYGYAATIPAHMDWINSVINGSAMVSDTKVAQLNPLRCQAP